MAPVQQNKRRRIEDDVRQPKKKMRVKRQKHYHSSSEDEDEDQPVVSDAPVKRAVEGKPQPKSILKQAQKATSPPPEAPNRADSGSEVESEEDDSDEGVDLDETEMNTALNAAPTGEEDSGASSEDVDEDEEPIAQDAPSTEESDLSASDSETSLTSSNPTGKAKKKRNDPSAFATSISKILDTKLTTAKRADPVLARSATASEANKSLADQKLEHVARNQLKTEKRQALEKGRVRDVLGLEAEDVSTGAVVEEEKRLKKVAQRGVVRLFNAVRAAQVRGEQGEVIAKGEGVVGMGQRGKRAEEMSKEGFLELISQGGAGKGQEVPA